ncbi:MAG: hypothetical protein JWO67_3273 [Streptosporangiaceae bacterium]|nr:hypothetical protein [Streptosporangiaceae bacterium]
MRTTSSRMVMTGRVAKNLPARHYTATRIKESIVPTLMRATSDSRKILSAGMNPATVVGRPAYGTGNRQPYGGAPLARTRRRRGRFLRAARALRL